MLDDAIEAFRDGRVKQTITLAESPDLCELFRRNRSLYANFISELLPSRQTIVEAYVCKALSDNPDLPQQRYGGETLLHAAAAAGRTNLVELLLNQCSDPNAQDQGSHTPLYSLSNECHTGGAAVARMLIERGSFVDACEGVKRCTPLHMAARRGNVEVGTVLVEYGVNLEARDSNSDTPLRRAVNCGKADFAAFLLHHGADPHSLRSRGLSPLLAARTEPMRRLFSAVC